MIESKNLLFYKAQISRVCGNLWKHICFFKFDRLVTWWNSKKLFWPKQIKRLLVSWINYQEKSETFEKLNLIGLDGIFNRDLKVFSPKCIKNYYWYFRVAGVGGDFLNCDWVKTLDCDTYDIEVECGTDGGDYNNR